MGKDCDESVEERAIETDVKTEAKAGSKMQPLPCEVRSKINEYERAAASEAKNGCLEKPSYHHVQ